MNNNEKSTLGINKTIERQSPTTAELLTYALSSPVEPTIIGKINEDSKIKVDEINKKQPAIMSNTLISDATATSTHN